MNPHLYETKWKEDLKKTHWRRVIYICWQKHHKKTYWESYGEKLWEETRAYREIFEAEMKTKNILRVNKRVYEVFTITDLWFMCTDQDVVRHYSLKFKWEHCFDNENFLLAYWKHS